MPIFNAPILEIAAAETRRYAGLKNAAFDETAIAAACETALLLLDVRGVWKTEPHFILEGRSITSHLAGCEMGACMTVNIGGRPLV